MIIMNSMEPDRGSSLIAFSVECHGYKCIQNLILIIKKITISESDFWIFLMMRFLNGHSEYYKSYAEFPDASMDVRLIQFG